MPTSPESLPLQEDVARVAATSQIRRLLPSLAGLCIAALALAVLHHTLGSVTLSAVSDALDQIPLTALALACLFTGISFAAIGVYDLVAVETVAPGRIPRFLAAATGAGGYATSNADTGAPERKNLHRNAAIHPTAAGYVSVALKASCYTLICDLGLVYHICNCCMFFLLHLFSSEGNG